MKTFEILNQEGTEVVATATEENLVEVCRKNNINPEDPFLVCPSDKKMVSNPVNKNISALIEYFGNSAYVDESELTQYMAENDLDDEDALMDLDSELEGYEYIETERGNGRKGGRRMIYHKN